MDATHFANDYFSTSPHLSPAEEMISTLEDTGPVFSDFKSFVERPHEIAESDIRIRSLSRAVRAGRSRGQ